MNCPFVISALHDYASTKEYLYGLKIQGLKLGNAYKIPKINVIRYVVENGVQPAARAAGS